MFVLSTELLQSHSQQSDAQKELYKKEWFHHKTSPSGIFRALESGCRNRGRHHIVNVVINWRLWWSAWWRCHIPPEEGLHKRSYNVITIKKEEITILFWRSRWTHMYIDLVIPQKKILYKHYTSNDPDIEYICDNMLRIPSCKKWLELPVDRFPSIRFGSQKVHWITQPLTDCALVERRKRDVRKTFHRFVIHKTLSFGSFFFFF